MSYDRDSFLSGLAVGRDLWRPSLLTGDVPPPIGWTADPEFLVYYADTWLGTLRVGSHERPFYKTYDGKALAIFGINRTGDGWKGPILVSFSSDVNATNYNYPGVFVTFDYLGVEWVYNSAYHQAGNNVQYSTDLEVYDFALTNDIVSVMQAANVRVWSV